jgi:hypothetical protein
MSGGILPLVVMPDDVRAAKARLDAFARSFQRTVSTCPLLPALTRRAWGDFYQGWRRFADTDASIFHAAAEYDAAERYEEHLLSWQAHLAQYCASAGPRLTRPQPPFSTASLESTVKTVAVAGVVIAIAITLRSVTR